MEMIQPPIYEFSVNSIIFGNLFLLTFTNATMAACFIFKNGKPVLVSFLLLTMLQIWLVALRINSKSIDIPSKCYHPDLLPHEEYLALKKQLDDASVTQKSIEEINSVLNIQDELRALCAIKMTFGYVQSPAIYKEIDGNKEIAKNNCHHATDDASSKLAADTKQVCEESILEPPKLDS